MRIYFLLFFIGFFYLVLLNKTYFLSIKSNEYYDALAKNNISKTLKEKPIRGIIYDRNHIPLAYNELRFDILFKPHMRKKELNQTIEYLEKIYPIEKEKLFKAYKRKNSHYRHDFVDVLSYVEYNELLPYFSKILMNENIDIQPTYLRIYPFKKKLSHVIGYVSKADKEEIKDPVISVTHIVGKNGIEKVYNKELQGTLGERVVEIDAKNRIVKELNATKAVSKNLSLYIDARLQNYIHNLFQKEKKRGVAIVMSVEGEMLSLVSYPSYDANMYVKGISQKEWDTLIHNVHRPFINKAILGQYPPGSVIKPSLGLIFMDAGKVEPYQKIFCPEYIEMNERKFRDWKRGGHGYTDMVKSIRESVDVYYYKLGLEMGINSMAKELRRMGFDAQTGIDLPGEKDGIIPDKAWKRKRYNLPWYLGETVNASIGQGYMLITPMQIAVNTALIAMEKLPTPMIVEKIGDKIRDKELKEVFAPKEKSFLPFVRRGMRDVCNHPKGTATRHIDTNITIAGKTGTAQVFSIPQEVKQRKQERELEYFKRSHAWLTTYGPYKKPQFVVTVMIEHGGHGGSAAGGIVSKIYNKLIELGYIKSEKKATSKQK